MAKQTLRRSAFAAQLLAAAGGFLVLALGTLHFETAGGATRYSTPVTVGLMALFGLRMLWLSHLRALDAGASGLGAWAAVVGSVLFAPFVTLVLLFIPSAPRSDGETGQDSTPLRVVLALPLGAVVGGMLLFLVQTVSQAL